MHVSLHEGLQPGRKNVPLASGSQTGAENLKICMYKSKGVEQVGGQWMFSTGVCNPLLPDT